MYGQNQYIQYPYNGYNYQNYGQRPYTQQQPIAPTQQQPQQQTVPNICYAKMEEAKPFIITAPNSSMLFIDREKNKALLKMTDNMCNSYTRYFDITETDESGKPVQKQDAAPQVDYSQFVTVEQYNTLVEQVKSMQKMIAGGKPNGNGTNTAKAT